MHNATFGLLLTALGALSMSHTAAAAPPFKPPHYNIVVIGIPLGGSFATAIGIGRDGLIDGYSNLTGDTLQHAFLWHSGHATDLGTLGGQFSAILGGTTAGFAETAQTEPLGEDFCETGTYLICLATTVRNGKLVGLPPVGGHNSSAYDNNREGQVAGVAEAGDFDPTCLVNGEPQPPFFQMLAVAPTVWTFGRPRALPIVAGDTAGQADGINDRGQAVGYSGQCIAANPAIHALMWEPDGRMINLGSLGGVLGSAAYSINSAGVITGASDLAGDLTSHAFLWTHQERHMIDLGTFPGDVASSGNSINASGEILGSSCDASGNCRNVLWDHGAIYDLSTLVPADSPWTVLFVNAITDEGVIVGSVVNQDGTLAPAALLVPRTDDDDATAPRAASAHPTAIPSLSPNIAASLKLLPRNLRERLAHSGVLSHP
jgi:probable HAF family extracellular repeat protein